jgi:hypothetical protein
MSHAIEQAINTRDAETLRKLAELANREQAMMLKFLAEMIEGEKLLQSAIPISTTIH